MGPDCWVMHHDFDTRLMAALNLPFIAKNSHFMPTVTQTAAGLLNVVAGWLV